VILQRLERAVSVAGQRGPELLCYLHRRRTGPIGTAGWFTQHICEGIEVTAGQLAVLQPALAQPGRADDATVAQIIWVHTELGERLATRAGRPRLVSDQASAR
jgi:hypothetical protein